MHGVNIGLGRAVSSSRGADASYNFLTNVLPAAMNFSRSSVSTDVINGVMTDFASGAVRVSSYNGLLVEPQRTNSLRNGEAQGATLGIIGSGGELPTNWGLTLPSGVTAEVVDANTINGFKYIDLKISGTASAGTLTLLYDGASQISAASGQTWAASFYIALISGALTNISSVNARVSGRASGSETEGTGVSYTPTIDPKRIFSIRTLNGGTTTHVISALTMGIAAGAVNATFRIAASQLEQGGSVTSYIRTNGSAQTRLADYLYTLTTNIPGYTGKGSVVVSARTARSWTASLTGQTLFNFSNGGGGSYIYFSKFRYGAGAFNLRCLQSYSQTGENPGPNIGLDTEFKAACAFALNDLRMSVNGGAIAGVTSNTPFPPSGIDRMYIGHLLPDTGAGHEGFTGYITKIDFYKGVKSNAELQVLSA